MWIERCQSTGGGPQPGVANELAVAVKPVTGPPLSAVHEEVTPQRGAGIVVDVLTARERQAEPLFLQLGSF